MKSAVEVLRAERYSRDNQAHEAQLTKVGHRTASHCSVNPAHTCDDNLHSCGIR